MSSPGILGGIRRRISFAPSDFGASLILWLDAQDTSTLLAGPSDPPVGDGDPIGRWTDKSGTSRHADAVPLTATPTRGDGTLNGFVSVVLGGTAGLACPTLGTIGQFELWAVIQIDSGVSTPVIAETYEGGSGYLTIYYDSGAIKATVDGVASMLSHAAPTGGSLLVRVIVDTSLSSGAVALGVNGTSVVSGSNASVGAVLAATGLYLGRRYDDTLGLTGEMGELIVVDRTLTTDEADSLTAYLTVKWGL
jgi:hypothetical protein